MPDVDPYGFFASDENEPRKKRTRSKPPRAVAASHATADDDDEQGASATDPYGFGHLDEPGEPDASPDMTRGPPPGPAGETRRAKGGEVRPESRAWYDDLADSAMSWYHGATGNTLDEVGAYYAKLGDLTGITHTGRSFEENRQRVQDRIDSATGQHPTLHGAGQMASGLAMSTVVPQGVLAQSAMQAALSAGSEYADSRDGRQTALAGGLGAATGVAGGLAGNWAAKRFGVVDPIKNTLMRGNMTPAEMRGVSPDITKRGGKALEAIEELAHGDPLEGRMLRGAVSPADTAGAPGMNITARGGRPVQAVEELAHVDPLEGQIVRGGMTAQEMAGAPTPDITARGGRPLEAMSLLERPQPPRPQTIPAETAYAYDPRAAGANTTPASGPPRPLPSGPGPSYDPLAAQASPKVPTPAAVATEAAVDDLKDPVVRTALEVFTPTLAKRSTAPELAEWAQKVVEHKLPPAAESALLRAWTKRVKDVLPNVDPERLMTHGASGEADIVEELAPKYALGELNAPKDALPRPRIGEPSGKSSLDYLLGDVDAPTDALPRPRLGDGPAAGALQRPSSPMLEARRAPMDPNVAPVEMSPSAPTMSSTLTSRRAPMDLGLGPLDVPAPEAVTTSTLGARRAATRPAEPIDIGAPSWDIASRAQRSAATPPGATLDAALDIGAYVPGVSMASRLARAGRRAWKGPEALPQEAGVYLNDTARQLTRGGVEAAWELGGPAAYGGKVNAQDRQYRDEKVAYADQATVNYALTETLHGGNTGLSQADEQALTSAVVKGDDDAIRATDFRLRQRYPGYARRVERALRNLNEED